MGKWKSRVSFIVFLDINCKRFLKIFAINYLIFKRRTNMPRKFIISLTALVFFFAIIVTALPMNVGAKDYLRVYLDGKEVISEDAPAQIINDRTMLPVRAISEALGLEVQWDPVNRTVTLLSPQVVVPNNEPLIPDESYYDIPIFGESVATSAQLRAVLKKNNPSAPDLVDLYLQIGKEYGIRGDLAFCQAAKETGWWRFGNLVTLDQNNYCGLGATGQAATGEENLNGANPDRIWYVEGRHGAFFKTPADGVEAQIQHLYAYATKNPLPRGKEIVDPRFTLVTKGIAPRWIDLNGRWAVPGTTYGQSIIDDYYGQAVPLTKAKPLSEVERLKNENAQLKVEVERLKRELAS